MTGQSEITTPKTTLAGWQTSPDKTTDPYRLPLGKLFPLRRKCWKGNITPYCETTLGRMDRATKGTTELMSRSITRRSLGLNMIVGLGGLQSARGLTDRLLTHPSPRQLLTPVVLEPTVPPPEIWGTWVYRNQASAIEMIVEQLELVIRPDTSGTMRYSRDVTEYQTRCEAVELDQYTQGNWSVNGQQLIFTGTGNS
jgi:hypothetical protein